MTEIETKKLLAVMVAAFPTTKVNDDSVRIYTRMLADLEYAAANAAVEQLLATSKWMPAVAEIRERAVSLQSGEVRAGAEAWGSVLKAIRGAGRYRRPGVDFIFADSVTGEAVNAMSWTELCDSENSIADRARFVELYDRLAIRRRRDQLSEGLPAMQRFRQLQAGQQQAELAAPRDAETRTVGDVLRLIAGGGS